MSETRIAVTPGEVVAAIQQDEKPSSESWILLRILDVRGLKLVEVPGESPARAIRRLFNVPHFRRVLHRLEYDGEIEVLTGAEWSERGVHFYDQRPTGRYWAMRHTDE